MKSGLIAVCLAATLPALAQVKLTRMENRIHIDVDAAPFGDFYYGPETTKPYVHPLRAASGTIVTRRFPMEEVAGETKDHKHHRGLWSGAKVVNDFNFWENEASYKNPKAGKIVLSTLVAAESGAKAGSLRVLLDWIDPTGNTLLTEDRTLVFRSEPGLRIIDADMKLTAKMKVVLGDEKDAFFAVRVADPLAEKGGARMLNAEGLTSMKSVWGKPSNWVDYSGAIGGEKLGVAIFDHPSNYRHPTRWHARDYGLLSVNPFCVRGFDPTLPTGDTTLEEGKSMRFRYRVVIHPGLDAAAIAALFGRYPATGD